MRSMLVTKSGSCLEQRCGRDRRIVSFPAPKYWGRRGRRRQIRRSSDRVGTYLDRYPFSLVWVTVVTLALCAGDAVFTLSLLQRGAVEINPFMALLIDTNLTLFVGVKMAFTALGLICLVVHQNFTVLRIFRARQFIYASMGLYFGIVVYEGGLLLAEPFFGP
jgi:hypothetical protein